jgi:HK97 family phage prohead protease
MREPKTGPLSLGRKFAVLSVKGVAGDGGFSGYASVFGEIDLGKDVIERGAFARSIGRKGAGGVRMLFQHDPAEPIGRWKRIAEDGHGLYVEGQLTLGAPRADEVYAHLKNRALDGLSIGFRTVRAETDRKTGIRRILEADLWEISVVTFPMLPSARIVTVKHLPDRRAERLAARIERARRGIVAPRSTL